MLTKSDAFCLLLIVFALLGGMMYTGVTGDMPFHLGQHHESGCPQTPAPKE